MSGSSQKMQLFYHSYGQGPPLIILHGLLGSSDNWHTIGKKLSEFHRVFTVDQRNHGRSPHSEEFTYEVMAQDIKEFMQEHGLSSASLMGHSMGGKVAMKVALSYPQLVDTLIVVDIAPRNYGPQHDSLFDALFSLDLQQFKTRRQVDDALAKNIPSIATRQFVMKNLGRNVDGSFRWKLNLDVIYRNYGAINESIDGAPFSKPVLFVRGGRSEYIRETDITGIKRLFPSASMVSIQDAGHWVHADAPENFTRIVLDFLRKPLS
jgi:pimeloyl-ACP methyl ester carboxylesterase